MVQKSSIGQTLEIFFQYPLNEFSLKEISRKVGIAHTSIRKNLILLEKKGFIEKRTEKRGTRKFPLFKAKREKLFQREKKVSNLQNILDSNLISFLEKECSPRCIVLFGSYARGEDTEESDIDLFLETKAEKLNLEQFERKLGRKIELHFKEKFQSYPPELKNNLINGIVLSGFLEGYA